MTNQNPSNENYETRTSAGFGTSLDSSSACRATPISALRFALAVLMVSGFFLTQSDIAYSQLDVVFTKRKNSDNVVKRKGAITEWLGLSLILNSNGREMEIDNDEIVDFQTAWSAEYKAGLEELKIGKTQLAILKFEEALKLESRPWAKRIIRSQLIDAFLSIEKPASAVEHFLRISEEDPQTRFVYLAPLPWTGSGNALESSAAKWIETTDPLTQLIGASWLLTGKDKDRATKVMQELARDIDPNIRGLATAQLWRTRVSVNAKQTEVWQGIIESMPRSVRAGPYYVLADAQARAGLVDEAKVNLMRLPILYPEHRSLSAAALYRTASLLHNESETKKSQSILNELMTYHPQSIWAQQATQ